ncbi:MAG: type IX secretion system outer membrane channel protein PorV [Saprospiraceae bacterium]
MKKFSFKAMAAGIVALLSFVTFEVSAQCILDENTGGYITADGRPCTNSVVSAVPFLRIVADARSGAMGDAGIAISPDANSMQFNDSNLAFSEKDFEMSATYTPWMRALGLQDVYLAYLSGYKKIDKLQTVGVSLRYFSLGSIGFTDPNGEPLGTGRPNEFEVKGTYARQLTDKFSAAIGGKFIYSNLAAGQIVNGEEIKPGIAGAADISFTYKTELDLGSSNADLVIGAAVTNLGSKITYTNDVTKDYLPANLGIGTALTLNLDEYNKITFAADVNKLLVPTPIIAADPNYDTDNDGIADYRQLAPVSAVFTSFGDAPGGFSEELQELMFSFGAEYWYDDQFALRAGYFHESANKGNRKYFTVGLGLKYNVFGLNLSYLVPTTNQRNPLDNTLRFSLLFDFGGYQDGVE